MMPLALSHPVSPKFPTSLLTILSPPKDKIILAYSDGESFERKPSCTCVLTCAPQPQGLSTDVYDDMVETDAALARALQMSFDNGHDDEEFSQFGSDGRSFSSSSPRRLDNPEYFENPFYRSREQMEQMQQKERTQHVELLVKHDEELQQFTRGIMATVCGKCRKILITSPGALVSHARALVSSPPAPVPPPADKKGQKPQAPPTATIIHSSVLCNACRSHTCMGCGRLRYPKSGQMRLGRPTRHHFRVAHCCAKGRLFLIWALLCGPEYYNPPRTASSLSSRLVDTSAGSSSSLPASPPAPGARGLAPARLAKIFKDHQARRAAESLANQSSSAGSSRGIGYGGPEDSGRFYDTDGKLRKPSVMKAKTRATPGNREQEEKRLQYAFGALSPLLPSVEWTEGRQMDSSDTQMVLAMLKRSPLLDKAAEYLRNGSMEECEPLIDLYDAILSFVFVVGQHPDTASVVFSPRLELPLEGALLPISFQTKKSAGVTQFGTLEPISDIVRTIGKQARQVLQHSWHGHTELDTTEGKRMLGLCTQFCEVSDFFSANRTQDTTMTGVPLTEDEAAAELRQWHRDNAVVEVPDSEFLASFALLNTPMAPAPSSTSAPGRMKRLVSEIANLHSSLPEGIYVRHISTRLDVMKAVIIGPKGTPYENGIFEFDIIFPAQYPQVPPTMLFKNTNGRRFNPNLYEDGKSKYFPSKRFTPSHDSLRAAALTLRAVCLSLLGTWQGERWQPGKSTILQVLVSIQSMIFCDEPWYNEPGRERSRNDAQSKAYNAAVRAMTVQYALMSWMPPAHRPVIAGNEVGGATGVPTVAMSSGLPSSGPIWSSSSPLAEAAAAAALADDDWATDGFDGFGAVSLASAPFSPPPPLPAFMPPTDLWLPGFPAATTATAAPIAPAAPALAPRTFSLIFPASGGLWTEVVDKHFGGNGRSIARTVQQWADEDISILDKSKWLKLALATYLPSGTLGAW